MDERQRQIAFIVDTIHNLCAEYEIGLIAKKLKSGQLAVCVSDATNGKEYVIVKSKED